MTTLGIVGVGQGPRPELLAELASWMPDSVSLVLEGALDGLTEAELDAVRAQPGEDTTIISLLADGTTIEMAAERLAPHIEAAIARAETRSPVVMLACTGAFDDLAHHKPLVHPDHVVTALLPVLAGVDATLGVLMPLPGQDLAVRSKFASVGHDILTASVSPFASGAVDAVVDSAVALVADGATCLVLDCFGYTAAMADAVSEVVDVPVILARRIAARVASEVA